MIANKHTEIWRRKDYADKGLRERLKIYVDRYGIRHLDASMRQAIGDSTLMANYEPLPEEEHITPPVQGPAVLEPGLNEIVAWERPNEYEGDPILPSVIIPDELPPVSEVPQITTATEVTIT